MQMIGVVLVGFIDSICLPLYKVRENFIQIRKE